MPYASSATRKRVYLEAIHPRWVWFPGSKTADWVDGLEFDAAFARTGVAHFHERLEAHPSRPGGTLPIFVEEWWKCRRLPRTIGSG